MSSQNIGDVALAFIRKPDELDITKDPSVPINALRDQYLITMYDSRTLVEKAKVAALETLIGRIPRMSDNMLIKAIEILFQITEVDMASIIGSGELKR